MAHIVKCLYCNEQFDRDKIPCCKPTSRRYAHITCAEEAQKRESTPQPIPDTTPIKNQFTESNQDLYDLEQYVATLLQLDYVSSRIRLQIKRYREENGFSYSGIQKTLHYFFEIKQNPVAKANGGIGIVPYVYEEAKSYYRMVDLANKNMESLDKNDIVPQTRIIRITSPKRRTMIIKHTFLEEDEE